MGGPKNSSQQYSRALINTADENGDGKLTKEEFIRGGLGNEEDFKKYDKDGDGIMTDSEMSDYHPYDYPDGEAKDDDDKGVCPADGRVLSCWSHSPSCMFSLWGVG